MTIEARLFPPFIALNSKLTNEKIRDDFLVFAACVAMDGEVRATHLSKDGYIRAMPGADCRGCQSRDADQIRY